MNSKLLTMLALIVGVVAAIFFIMILGAGDDAIQSGEAASKINPLMYLAYIVLGLAILITVLFTLKNILTNPKALKSTLIGLGAFAVLAIIAYILADGSLQSYYPADVTEGTSKMISAGLNLFFILAIIAIGAMLVSGVKKMINN